MIIFIRQAKIQISYRIKGKEQRLLGGNVVRWLFGGYSVVIQLLFGGNSIVIQLLFSCYSVVIRLLFGCNSVVIRLLFGCYSVVIELSRKAGNNAKRITAKHK